MSGGRVYDPVHPTKSDQAESEPAAGGVSGPSSPSQTVSEIYPDDSASYRHARTETQSMISRDDEGPTGGDAASVASLKSLDAQTLYVTVDGRAFTAQSDIYCLPADDVEQDRLDMQHRALCLVLHSLFPCQDRIIPLLQERPQDPPAVMDVGTGSGRWAVDLATTYPWVQVVGVDLVPPTLIPKDTIPINCRFEIDDANLPMDHYEDTFSVVHARFMHAGINDIDSFFYQFARTLRPGGVLIKATVDEQILDENLQPFPFVEPGAPGFSWVQYMAALISLGQWHRGGLATQSKLWWREWLENNPNYSEVLFESVDVPVGSWKTGLSDRLTYAANLMKEDLIGVFPAWRRLLLEDGHPETEVDHWIEETRKDLTEMRSRCHLRFRYLVAVRGENPWEERQSLISEDLTSREAIKGLDLRKSWKRAAPSGVPSGP